MRPFVLSLTAGHLAANVAGSPSGHGVRSVKDDGR